MKRVIASLLVLSVFAGRVVAQGDAVALAAQREAEENMKRLSATIGEVQAAQEQQHKEILDLRAEVDRLRSDVSKANNNAATQEALKRLNEQILKVDESRVADNKRIQETLEKLAHLITERPVLPAPTRPDIVAPPAANGGGNSAGRGPAGRETQEGFDYVVAKDDTLDVIAKAYRSQGIMVTRKMIMDANPTVKWERLRIGQKIFIPKPK
jgi:TolA-binding protein